MSWWDSWTSYAGGLLDPSGSVNSGLGAQAQADAQKEALKQQQAQFDQMFGYNQQQTNLGIGYAQQYGNQGTEFLKNYYMQGQNQLAGAGDTLKDTNQSSLSALAGGYGTSQDQLSRLGLLANYGRGAATAQQATSAGAPTMFGISNMRAAPGAYNVMNANGQIDPYDVTGQRSMLQGRVGQGDALGSQLNAQTGALANRVTQGVDLRNDPGYRFRQQQGEQAVMRQASAQGGRMGGATMKALADYNQGLASQEYGAAFNRQQQTNSQLAALQQSNASNQLGLLSQQYGATGNVDQMRQAAMFNQAGRSDAAAQQYIQNQIGLSENQAARSDAREQFNASQYNSFLGDYSNAYNANSLDAARRQDALNQQAQQNQYGLAQIGYGSLGQAAQMSNQYGSQMADLYGQYGSNMANLAGQRANMYAQGGNNLASLYSNMGTSMGNLATGNAGTNANLSSQMMGSYQNYAQYGGMVQQNLANQQRQNMNTGIQALGAYAAIASDRRLKTDLEPVKSPYEAIGLQGYRWRWNDHAAALGLAGHDQGVIAQDVAKLYPEAVETGADGYLRVRYAALDALVAGRA